MFNFAPPYQSRWMFSIKRRLTRRVYLAPSSEAKVRNETRGRQLFHIRPQCLFSSVVSTYRYNTVSFCKTKKMKLPLQSSMCTECQSRRLHLFCMYTCSPWASTFPNVRHFEGLKHLWIYIYIYLYIFSSTNKQLDSTVRSLTGEKRQQQKNSKRRKKRRSEHGVAIDGRRGDAGSRNTVSLWVFQYIFSTFSPGKKRREGEEVRRDGWMDVGK